MPLGKLHVKVIRARNLRVADLNGASDPFVSLRLANASTKFEQLQSAPEFGKTTVVQKVRLRNPMGLSWKAETEIFCNTLAFSEQLIETLECRTSTLNGTKNFPPKSRMFTAVSWFTSGYAILSLFPKLRFRCPKSLSCPEFVSNMSILCA